MDTGEIILPFEGKRFFQDRRSMAVSGVSQLLYEEAIKDEREGIALLEAGCGAGIVCVMTALSRPDWHITGIDIQPELIELARTNAALSEVEIEFLVSDIAEHNGKYDLIISNPPWRKKGSGMLSPHHSRNISRFEIHCEMDDVISLILRCLKDDGKALLIYPTERMDELLQKAKNAELDIITNIIQTGNKAFFIATIRMENQ
ncbi:MAG TPA: methyltransferase domain-containing protein [Candidatus Cloacimonetes bacterium]|nr:methyltransferase domain-containing protein [Candidatus Cloacimonadota bacterium]